jgi:hypothetical protein
LVEFLTTALYYGAGIIGRTELTFAVLNCWMWTDVTASTARNHSSLAGSLKTAVVTAHHYLLGSGTTNRTRYEGVAPALAEQTARQRGTKSEGEVWRPQNITMVIVTVALLPFPLATGSITDPDNAVDTSALTFCKIFVGIKAVENPAATSGELENTLTA